MGILATATSGLADGYGKVTVTLMMIAGLALISVYPFLRIYDPAHYRFVIMIPIYIMILVRMCTDKVKGLETYQSIFSFCLLTLSLITALGYVTYLF
jgi:hypothetical protein